MTRKTRESTCHDVRCAPINATSSAARAGTTAAFRPHVRPNTVGSRDFHGNIKNSKAVAVNLDDGHESESTFASSNTGECTILESCELILTGHIAMSEEDVAEGACSGKHHVVAAPFENPMCDSSLGPVDSVSVLCALPH